MACAACGYAVFVNPRPTGTPIIVDGDRFLVIRRARPPQQGWWDLPGGFCDGFEHPRDAAVREAREELGVDIHLGAFVGMWIGTYEFQDEPLPVLDCFWLATLAPGATITLDPAEGTELAWMPLSDPPPLAFSTMESAIREVRRSSGRLVP
ncbi:NUDIX hydrolase [Dactylosporangium sp. NBC_01737]|uniref:NUDIX hydrolase n=1 Tax=Dactylosporangium sp. NBC_01737 TaxID=2975959 RepID=UPI002E0F645C|nr:NUDIX hydrolase [Dactylosporangium sp. NBC_01737]